MKPLVIQLMKLLSVRKALISIEKQNIFYSNRQLKKENIFFHKCNQEK